MRLLAVTLVTASVALVSCSSDKSDASAAADELAQELSAHKLTSHVVTGGSESDYDTLVAGLGTARPRVSVSDVSTSSGSADATLSWSWDLDGRTWSYHTRATLTDTSEGWRTRWSPTLVEPDLRSGDRLTATELLAKRGDILGVHGQALVKDRPVLRFGIDKSKVPGAAAVASAERLARFVGVSPGPYVRAVRAAGDQAFVEAITLRPADARALGTAYLHIKGAVALAGTLPLAPTREFAAPLLGRVGPVTAELLASSHGELHIGDQVGLSGLEARYDDQLRGTPGAEVQAVASDGSRRTLFHESPVAGTPLRTTLDLRLQSLAEHVFAVPDPNHPGPATALVAIRPSTGAILAAASGAGASGQDIATYGRYAPGSTFKVVTALALLRSGLHPGDEVTCPPTVDVAGKQFKNYSDYPSGEIGRIRFIDAFANSCNTAFIGSRHRIHGSALADAAAALGFGVDHDVGFPAYFGQVPRPAGTTEAAADLIGQGRITASPLAMATVAASVRAGRTVVPYLLPAHKATASPSQPLTSAEAAELRRMMRAVVTEGSGQVLADLGGDVGAKTGTAEFGTPGPGGQLPTHAWMIATRGDLAVAAFVETGSSGSGTAGPLLHEFLSGAGR